jgi:hypothetical protein
MFPWLLRKESKYTEVFRIVVKGRYTSRIRLESGRPRLGEAFFPLPLKLNLKTTIFENEGWCSEHRRLGFARWIDPVEFNTKG